MAEDLALPTEAVEAASSAVDLIDQMADQVERFVTGTHETGVPRRHRMQIQAENGKLVSRQHGHLLQAIGPQELAGLPASQLRHIKVLEQSMENHYSVWAAVYPQLGAMDSPVQKARVEQQLQDVIRSMRDDLDSVLGFLESCGLLLDDHYMHIRHLVRQV